jgi:ADP-ribose pyrophosphatase YjhB (NUDIX family)
MTGGEYPLVVLIEGFSMPIWRPTARLLVVDPGERVLLFGGHDPEGRRLWFTPGGGVHRGETLTQAAVRELAEETGLARTEAELGPVVANSAGLWTADGRVFFGADSFFLLRTADSAVDTSGQEELERSVIMELRWWAISELRATDHEVSPLGLAGLLESLLRDGVPAKPMRLPWRSLKS